LIDWEAFQCRVRADDPARGGAHGRRCVRADPDAIMEIGRHEEE
jgi:hypothetical protein